MRKSLLLVLSAVFALSMGTMSAAETISGKALFKSSGRTLKESSAFHSRSQLERIPTKAEVYGGAFQGQAEICPSSPLTETGIIPTAPAKASNQRTARALLIYADYEKTANKIIEVPITAGSVGDFEVVANKIPSMPYKAYGEYIVNAVAFDNKFMASTFCSMMYSQTNSVYTVADWNHLYNYDYRIADLEATALSYNSADGVCYGVFQGTNPTTSKEEWFFGRWIDPSSYTIPEPISWLGSEAKWYAMTISPEGIIYAIDADCNLLKVDKTTGAYTVVGSTGLTNKYKTSACYDAVNNRILFATSLDTGSAMTSIDPATGRATILYLMPHGEQIVGLFIPDPEAEAKAPAAPTNVTADFPLGSLSGNIRFKVPTTYFDGTAASGTVNYEVSIDSEIVSTGTATYGSDVAAPVTVKSSGNTIVTVRLSNAAGKSPITRETLFCGTPRPRTPYFRSFTYNEQDKCFEMTWMPNSDNSGQNGGVVNNDDLTYELVRYPDMKVIPVEKGELTIKDSFTPSGNFEIVYYDLCAIYHGSRSYTVRSIPTKFGIIIPPFTDEMMSNMSSAAYSYLTTANDKLSWSYIGPVTQQEKQHGWMNHGTANSSTPMDSYLVMAPMRLEKGKVYTLAFTAACTNTSWRNEKMAVYMGKEISVEGLRQQTLIEPISIYERREENGERHSCNFSAPEDGIYYIAFHHNSGPNLRFLYIGDISVSAPIDGQVPAEVTNLTLKAAPNGQLQASISFDMPTKSVNGETLTGKTSVKIYRNDEKIADTTPSATSFTFTDEKAANGVNNYVIVPYNANGDGLKSTANVFVGVGKPTNPAPHAWYGANDGQAVVSWPQVAVDEFGTTLSTANTRYEVQRDWILSNGTTNRELIAANLSGFKFTDQYCNANDEQTSASYWVRTVTDGGTSQWVSTRKLGLGKPYTTPWIESFPNRACDYNWHTVGSSMNWAMIGDDIYDDVKSVDNDNGFLLCTAAAENTSGLIYSGCISIPADMVNPVFSFYYLNQGSYHGTPVKNIVEMVILDSQGQKHVKKAVCNGPWGWERMAYDMSKYKGQKVQVGVYMECIDRPSIALDAFRISSRLETDIDMVQLSGPEEITVGQDAVLTVSYENLGVSDIPAGYKVQLYRGSELVDQVDGKAIKSDGRESVNFTIKTNGAMPEKESYQAVIKVDNDDDMSNNRSNFFELAINHNIGYPEPGNTSADRTSDGARISWTAPDMSKTPHKTYTEDFESFESFAKTIPEWTILDEDKGIVSPISNYIQTSETWGSPFGFFVQDSSVEPFNKYEEFTPSSGKKYMASQLTADANGNSIQNNDWLISPELSGDAQTAAFMGKSISSSWPESFRVYYSMTGKEISDFQLIGGVVGAPSAWVHYTAKLPAGSRYFAIQCVSEGCLQFMVDDVTLRLKSSDLIDLDLIGYNIYRDGKLVNAEPVKSLSYIDTQAGSKQYSYLVTAVYSQGESQPSPEAILLADAGVDNLSTTEPIIITRPGVIMVTIGDLRNVEIYSASGLRLHNSQGACTVNVPAGVYIVKVGSRISKVIVD